MTRTFLKSTAIATLTCGAVFASQPASAMGIRNCTDIVIKVQLFKNNDALRVVSLGQANIGVGDFSEIAPGGGLKQIKVFKAQVFDKMLFVKGGKDGNQKYSIVGNGGSYTVSDANHC